MSNSIKIAAIAALITTIGFIAAFNAKWIREGLSPWWTGYIVSFCSATIYAYLARNPFFPLTYTSVFQTFFFHGAWYLTTLFVIGEQVQRHQLFGLAMVFGGMIIMSIK